MQKKILAVAVAGALGAPVAALAQTSTVQIYGTIIMEYAYVDQGTAGTLAAQGLGGGAATGELNNVDILSTLPGANIGFKGEEKLGGGLSAWFQCESSADITGAGQFGWCGRNSAIGLKGGFGNLFIGRWDTPMKRTMAPGMVGSQLFGVFGTDFLLAGGATSFVGNAGAAGRGSFIRRQSNSINYDSPNFGGFQVLAAFSTAQAGAGAAGTASTTAAVNAKPRVLSLAAQYSAGPLFVSGGYERHNEFGATATAGPGVGDQDDKGWFVAASYTWGPVKFGGVYTQQKFEPTAATTAKVKAWTAGIDWRIVGPHGLRAAYTQADDVEGNSTVPILAANAIRSAALIGGLPGDTGAKQWQIRYVYTFSKRTEVSFGYVKLDNDSQAQYTLGGSNQGTGLAGPGNVVGGNNQDAWATVIRHTF